MKRKRARKKERKKERKEAKKEKVAPHKVADGTDDSARAAKVARTFDLGRTLSRSMFGI